MHLNPEVRNEDGTRHLQRADIETVRQTDGWMDGWMGWMDGCSLKFLFRGCTCPQGPFFCEKRHFLEKVYFLKNRKINFYEKILFCYKNHTRRSGMKFRVDPSAERLKLI